MTDPAQVELVARGLDERERNALLDFPRIRDANPVRLQAAVTFGSLWRKFSQHRSAMLAMEKLGVVERRVSRGETLWRPTKPLGLAVRQHIEQERNNGR